MPNTLNIVDNGNNMYTFTDISGISHIARVSIYGVFETYEHLTRAAESMNFWVKHRDRERDFIKDLDAMQALNMFVLPKDKTRPKIREIAEKDLEYYNNEVERLEKVFENSLL